MQRMFADSISLENFSDELSVRAEMADVLSSFLCDGALLEDCGAGNNRVTRLFLFVKNP